MTFTAPIFTKLTVIERHPVQIFYTEFHPNQLRNVAIMGRGLFALLSKCMIVTAPIFTKLIIARQLFLKKCFFFLLLLFLFFFNRYNPLWTLASNTVFLHSRRSEAIACLIFVPIFKSSLPVVNSIVMFSQETCFFTGLGCHPNSQSGGPRCLSLSGSPLVASPS